MALSGIHHVSAICGAPQVNVDFYVETLGLRLVKRTVNFDNPGNYHLYYGDETGRPGTLLTFFPMPGSTRGASGRGMVAETAFAVPMGSIDYWTDRLAHLAHEFLEPRDRFGQRVLPLHDPDGLPLEIVESPEVDHEPGWSKGHVDRDHRLRTLSGVALAIVDPEPTAALLETVFGFVRIGEEGERIRYRAPGQGPAAVVDLVPTGQAGRPNAGTVHHVAFRASDDQQQTAIADDLRARGLTVTDVRDRKYFRSIYFREPGGVLFEIATDGPGFAEDEDEHHLGAALQLPPWLESRRLEIERRLPPIAIP